MTQYDDMHGWIYAEPISAIIEDEDILAFLYGLDIRLVGDLVKVDLLKAGIGRKRFNIVQLDMRHNHLPTLAALICI